MGADEDDPLCFLLEVDEYCLLLDCGWHPSFDTKLLEPLERVLKRINAILVSFPDIQHLGALPYLVGKLGLDVPVYSTIPVYKMGLMFMYDAYLSRANSEPFEVFNLDDVDTAFDKFTQLKYSQHVSLPGGIAVTPFPAGHMIGGTVWKIQKETEEIVYAVDFNHKKEKHLNGANLETFSSGRPSLMITDAKQATSQSVSKKSRDQQLMESIVTTLNNGGNVLLPVDTAGRVLELLITIDQYWSSNKLPFPVAMLSYMSFNSVEFAKSQLEWMSDSIMKTFDNSRENPFSFKHIRLFQEKTQLDNLPNPKVILATTNDLESGFSREILVELSDNPRNLVLLTDKGASNTLSRRLFNQESRRQPVTIEVLVSQE